MVSAFSIELYFSGPSRYVHDEVDLPPPVFVSAVKAGASNEMSCETSGTSHLNKFVGGLCLENPRILRVLLEIVKLQDAIDSRLSAIIDINSLSRMK